jgi:predicted metal-dependent peptidase
MLNRKAPFFGRLTMQLHFIEDEKCKTMGVCANGDCFYAPSFVTTISDSELEAVICHEVMHCALLHLTRGQKLNPKIYNIAADLVINDMIQQNNMTLPKDALLPDHTHTYTLKHADGELEIKDINKRGAESIYTEIRNAIKDQQQDMQQGFDEHHYGDKGTNPANGGNGKDDAYWQNKVVESAMASRLAGKSPMGMDRIIDGILNPKMSWTQLLQRFVRKNIPYDFTWSRPNKKTYSTGIYLPQTEKTGVNITFLVDTSGSMNSLISSDAKIIAAILETLNVCNPSPPVPQLSIAICAISFGSSTGKSFSGIGTIPHLSQ